MKIINQQIGTICVVLLLSVSIKAQHEESYSRFSQWLIHDPLSVSNNFDNEFISQFTFVTLAVAGISIIDEHSSSYFREEYNDSRFLSFTDNFGAVKYMAPVSAAIFGTSLLTRNTKFQDAAFTSFQSVLNTAITTNISKFIFARSRPYENDGAYDFDFFHPGETSFPSGHSSTAFALFTPWVVYYPGLITYSLMAIPTGTLLARIAKGKHWASDVTAGALIGAYWGYYLSKKHLGKNEPGIEFQPFVKRNEVGFSLKASF
ncbi:MAG: phosphatase PAP2 family protein [Balneolaceae bacterium]|nr:phosphatase PAP2 family protein [Balneolaceae bacterium]MBO6545151.1 phosphatase PAP2 family protein [Balneolaceae bacterium]MBO6646547.1 phosphatase PAP2 family protein [Balneolaceae bacterium]